MTDQEREDFYLIVRKQNDFLQGENISLKQELSEARKLINTLRLDLLEVGIDDDTTDAAVDFFTKYPPRK
jgi:hypothetical protein